MKKNCKCKYLLILLMNIIKIITTENDQLKIQNGKFKLENEHLKRQNEHLKKSYIISILIFVFIIFVIITDPLST